jgi:hypothetical protein
MSTAVVAVLDLKNAERVWLVAHDAPIPPEQREMIETVRGAVLEAGADAIAAVSTDPDPHDFRAFAAGVNPADGTRFYMDIALQHPTNAETGASNPVSGA